MLDTHSFISSNRDAAAQLHLFYCLLMHARIARCFGMLWLWMLTKYKICGFFHVIKCLDTFNWPHLSNFFCYVANFRVRSHLPQHFPHIHKTSYFYHIQSQYQNLKFCNNFSLLHHRLGQQWRCLACTNWHRINQHIGLLPF